MADPTIPLDLFGSGDARLWRWGPLADDNGGVWAAVAGSTRMWLVAEAWDMAAEPDAAIPLHGLAIDAALRSSAATLGWPVTETTEAPTIIRRLNGYSLNFKDRDHFVPGPPAQPYPEAVALVARAIAGRAA